jgi:hypothetical protein
MKFHREELEELLFGDHVFIPEFLIEFVHMLLKLFLEVFFRGDVERFYL